MQLGNTVVQFEEKLSSAGRDSASYDARALDAFRIAAITRLRETCARVVHCEPETGSIAAGYLFNDIARAYIDLFAKNAYYRSRRADRMATGGRATILAGREGVARSLIFARR